METGTLSWRFVEDGLLLAPTLVEIVGGAEDGEMVYPFFSLDVSHLVAVFDEVPNMHWNTMHDEFSLEGKIAGEDAWITFFRVPFDDENPEDLLDPKGAIRKRKPSKDWLQLLPENRERSLPPH